MAEETYKKTNYTVTIVPKGSFPEMDAPQEKIAYPPRYNRERDEPALKRAWQIVNEQRALGLLKPRPPMPAGGIRLLGRDKPSE